MDFRGWSALDLVAGSMLTAGVAFSLYTFRRVGRRPSTGPRLSAATEEQDGDVDHVLLNMRGRQPGHRVIYDRRLAVASARRAVVAKPADAGDHGAASGDNNRDVSVAAGPWDGRLDALRARGISSQAVCAAASGSPQVNDQSMVSRGQITASRPNQGIRIGNNTQATADLVQELRRYQVIMDRWTAVTETKMRRLEEQNMIQANQLLIAHQALMSEQQQREDTERRAEQAEARVQGLETQLQQQQQHQQQQQQQQQEQEQEQQQQQQAPEQDATELQRLQRQVSEMEEQLQQFEQNEITVPHAAAMRFLGSEQQWIENLDLAQTELRRQQTLLEELDHDIDILSEDFNKSRSDNLKLSEDKEHLQDVIQSVKSALLRLVTHLLDCCASKDIDTTEMMDLLDHPERDLQLNRLVDSMSDLVIQM